MKSIIKLFAVAVLGIAFGYTASASSHREAPLIANDPLADNTDLYAFRSPCDTSQVVLIADYIPFELPQGGPNYYNFGENIRYEIHVDNNLATPGDDIIYRFTFTHENQDPTTFFNIRLGKQNLKTTYKLERSMDGGMNFDVVISNGVVPPNNIGPRSIEDKTVGLGTTYESLRDSAVATASTGETVFCGPADDPFFVDLGAAFDVGGFRPVGRDGLAKYNCHSICIQVPISTLQKDRKDTKAASSILDGDFVIGVYASASRQTVTTFNPITGHDATSGDWKQVSRLGMPLTNEVINPIGQKDKWNATYPSGDSAFIPNFVNPELGLYMSDAQFGSAVPGLADLRIQTNSQTLLGNVDFQNDSAGLYVLKGNPALKGTALDPALYGNLLLPDDHSPRSVDILPIFLTGVPNLPPYQLATGKPAGNPLAPGKPFINNFLPTLGDYLRLNMAVPVTSRTDSSFSSLGIIEAAVLGLTDPKYNTTTAIQFIPNMDGFPNGRRLEDDVATISLQAVSGVALAAIGLFYDDYNLPDSAKGGVTPDLARVLGFNAGVTKNDTTLKPCFPYVQTPWPGFTGDGYVGPHSEVLPVHFLSFTATKVNQTVALSWNVENQTNSNYYKVEYSVDGNHYATLTTIATHSATSYQYVHSSPSLKNINYYRITQVDKDGRTITSPVKTAVFTVTNIITVSPNPAISFVKVYSTLPNLRLTVYDNAGRKVVSQVMNSNDATISLSSLARGVYTVVATDNSGKRLDTKKIVKL